MRYWQWPATGPLPTTGSTLTEVFSGIGSMNAEYLVRESVQNSLDANLDEIKAVKVKFTFGSSTNQDDFNRFFGDISDYREVCNLPPMEDPDATWLMIEDTNTTGLKGDLSRRQSPFWTFWLDWGAVKKGSSLGRYGVGRTAILGASQILTIVGMTKQEESGREAICGHSLLKATEYQESYRSSYAFFAEESEGSIWKMWPGSEASEFMQAFGIDPFEASGTKLFIPYPRHYITEDRVKAALIAHFTPALLDETLIASVNGEIISERTILEFSPVIRNSLRNTSTVFMAFKRNPEPFIKFQGEFLITRNDESYEHRYEFELDQATVFSKARVNGQDFTEDKLQEKKDKMLDSIDEGHFTIVKISFPIIEKNGTRAKTSIMAAIHKVDGEDKDGVELHYRKGMAIYGNKKHLNGQYHAAIFADDPEVSEYLNICEGMAHLKWDGTRKIEDDLKEKYRHDDVLGIQKLCTGFFQSIITWLNLREGEGDADIFSDIFSIKLDKPRQDEGDDDGEDEEELEIESSAQAWEIALKDSINGFRVSGVPSEGGFPLRLKIVVAYDNGTSNPQGKWDPEDFKLSELSIESDNCKPEIIDEGNSVVLEGASEDFWFEVGGFDPNRQLDVLLRKLT